MRHVVEEEVVGDHELVVVDGAAVERGRRRLLSDRAAHADEEAKDVGPVLGRLGWCVCKPIECV